MINKIYFTISVQSTSDLITNSSSEVFTIKSNENKDLIKKLLEDQSNKFIPEYYDLPVGSEERERAYKEYQDHPENYNSSSGMGGEIEILDFYDRKERFRGWYIDKAKWNLFTDEIYSLFESGTIEEQKSKLEIDIDWGFQKTIDFLIKNFYVTHASRPYYINEEGRVVGLQQEWDEDNYVKCIDDENTINK